MIEEDELVDDIVVTLLSKFENSQIQRNKYLDKSGRYVDIHVQTEGEEDDLAIEVENGWESVTTGLGQAEQYASELGARPIVIVPAEEVEFPEILYLSDSEVDIITW